MEELKLSKNFINYNLLVKQLKTFRIPKMRKNLLSTLFFSAVLLEPNFSFSTEPEAKVFKNVMVNITRQNVVSMGDKMAGAVQQKDVSTLRKKEELWIEYSKFYSLVKPILNGMEPKLESNNEKYKEWSEIKKSSENIAKRLQEIVSGGKKTNKNQEFLGYIQMGMPSLPAQVMLQHSSTILMEELMFIAAAIRDDRNDLKEALLKTLKNEDNTNINKFTGGYGWDNPYQLLTPDNLPLISRFS